MQVLCWDLTTPANYCRGFQSLISVYKVQSTDKAARLSFGRTVGADTVKVISSAFQIPIRTLWSSTIQMEPPTKIHRPSVSGSKSNSIDT